MMLNFETYDYKRVSIYFDQKGTLIAVPCGHTEKFGYLQLDIFSVLKAGYDDDEFEKFILEAFDACFSVYCSDDLTIPAAIQKYTKKKSYNAAVKGYQHISFEWQKNEGYTCNPYVVNKEHKGSFTGLRDKGIKVPLAYEQGALAQAFRQTMAIIKQQESQGFDNPPRLTFDLLCEKEASYVEPQGDNFINAEDYGVAEIYQGYSYYKKDDDEHPVA